MEEEDGRYRCDEAEEENGPNRQMAESASITSLTGSVKHRIGAYRTNTVHTRPTAPMRRVLSATLIGHQTEKVSSQGGLLNSDDRRAE
jgi:hypothetical protein